MNLAVENMLNWQSGMNVTALIQSAFATKKDNDKRVLKSQKDLGEGVDLVAGHLKVSPHSRTLYERC